MQLSPVSFGQKIPKYQVEIKDKFTALNVPATVYEYDCNDETDYEEVKSLDRRWAFKNNIVQNMIQKHAMQTLLNEKSNHSFYSIEANGETLGLLQLNSCNGESNIDYITTKPRFNEYKYIGRALVACVGKEFLKKKGYELTVATAIDSTIPFYKRLGFKTFGDDVYRMTKQDVQDLISQTEQKTEAQIVDLRG